MGHLIEDSTLLGPPRHEHLQGELSLHQLALKPLVFHASFPQQSWEMGGANVLHERMWIQ